MYNAHDLAGAMGQAALSAVENGKPCGLFYGMVLSVAPLSIGIDQKLILGAEQLVLSTLVQEFSVDMTVDHETLDENPDTTHEHPGASAIRYDLTHRHRYKGRKTFLVHLGLLAGEKVVLIREQGGQKFLVLDRVRG